MLSLIIHAVYKGSDPCRKKIHNPQTRIKIVMPPFCLSVYTLHKSVVYVCLSVCVSVGTGGGRLCDQDSSVPGARPVPVLPLPGPTDRYVSCTRSVNTCIVYASLTRARSTILALGDIKTRHETS